MGITIAPLELLASAARSSSGQSSNFNAYDYHELGCDICIDVTAVSGTLPILDIWIETTNESTPSVWYKLRRIPRISAAGNYMTTILGGIMRQLRLNYTIGGTNGNFTFSANLIKHI